MPASFEGLRSLCQFLTDLGIKNLIYGGWAVDLHAGRQTREHEDIDHFISCAQRDVFLQALRRGEIDISERSSEDQSRSDSHHRVTVISDKPYKTVWETSLVPGGVVETHVR